MLKQVGKKENHVLCKMFPFPQKTAPTTTAKATAKTVEKAPLVFFISFKHYIHF